MTPVLAAFASDGFGWRGVVGPVVSEGTSSAAVQRHVAIVLLLPDGSQGLFFEYTNVTVWCGQSSMQSAKARHKALAAFIEQGPASESALPVGIDLGTRTGPPDFASSPVQAGSYLPGDVQGAEVPGAPPDGDEGASRLVLGSTVGGCIGMVSTSAACVLVALLLHC